MSRADLKDAYRCGTYHRRGLKGCTSHHIRVDKLDEILKTYLQMVKDNSAEMLTQLNADLAKEAEDMKEQDRSEENLEEILLDLQEELKATKRQRIRDIMKHPDQEEMLEETYDELEDDLTRRIAGIQNQIDLTVDRRNTIIRVNRTAKLALEVFDDILNKDKLDRSDLQLIIERIRVYEDHVDVQLKADIQASWITYLSHSSRRQNAKKTRSLMSILSVTVTLWRFTPLRTVRLFSRNTRL